MKIKYKGDSYDITDLNIMSIQTIYFQHGSCDGLNCGGCVFANVEYCGDSSEVRLEIAEAILDIYVMKTSNKEDWEE